jgi:aspartyl-tRNA(Asn)/glutamyl-tRNA(Gln) amidotransferase subunit A
MHWTLHTAADAVRNGRITPVELLETCLAQIERLEPRVHAWVFVDRDGARSEAKRLTAELQRGQYRGPLHGIPVGVKDIFDVFDWPTAAGSRLWARSIARRDATVVSRLREAGAVFVGKTVTTQYASFDPPVTRNPWKQDRTPGGSSSGSAAGVACGMCLVALASQTGGSITRPAAYCGVAGCKPTWGRVSTDGVMPLAPSMDHIGAVAPCVTDLALVMQVIAGPDPRDPSCSPRPLPDLVAGVRSQGSGVGPPRIGRVRGLFEGLADGPVRSMMDRVATQLRGRGAPVIDLALPAGFAEVIPRHRAVMAVEGAAFHQVRLQRHPEDYAPNIRQLLEEGLACPAAEYARCKDHQKELSQAMLALFDDVDILLTPATTSGAPGVDTTGNPAFNAPWSYTALPTVCFPSGWSPDGLPLGLQLVGRPWGEAELLAAARWCEDAVAFEAREVSGG